MQATTTTTRQLRGYLALLRTTVPVWLGRGRYQRRNGTRVLVHLTTDVNDGYLLCGGRVGNVQGEVSAATQEPHHSQQCPRCWVELGRAAAHFEAQLPALEQEVRRAAQRRWWAGEFASEELALEQVRQEAGGERLEGVEPPQRSCLECAWEGHTGNHEEHQPPLASPEEEAHARGAYEAYQRQEDEALEAARRAGVPYQRPPILAAAEALGLSDCGPGCTCRGTAAPEA